MTKPLAETTVPARGAGTTASGTDRAVTSADAEAAFCRSFAPRIWGYGLRHLREPAEAAELVQDVLLTVLLALRAGQVREPDKIGSFVLGTCRRVASDVRRTRERRAELLSRFGPTSFPDTVAPPEPVEADALEDCLARLTHTSRRVLVMTYFEDAEAPRIAENLGLAAGNVRVIRHRALDALRSCLEQGATAS